MNPSFAITTDKLTLGYKNHAVITNFTASINEGDFVGVFGPNGAGKTTLLFSLLGLLKPMSGTLKVLGQTPSAGNAQIGYLPQFIPQLNVAISGYTLLAATVKGQRWGLPWVSREERREIETISELVGAQSYVKRPFMQLSGGERQRIMLAQALLGKPRILLLDEPLSNLDPNYQHVLIGLLKQIQAHLNITLLLTAHDVNPLLSAMTRVLYLARGHAAIGTVNEVITSDTLSMLYGTPIEVIKYNDRIFVMHGETGHPENDHCH